MSRSARSILEKFLEVFPGVGIAINRWDKLGMLYTIFLSRNTVTWMREIFKMAESEDKLSTVRLRKVGRSYQLKQLYEVREEFKAVFHDRLLEGFYSLDKFFRNHKRILSVKYCGPKIAHGWGSFSLGLTCLTKLTDTYSRLVEF